MKPILHEEERNIPYSNLFFKPLAKVDPKLIKEMDLSPVDPNVATSIHDRNDILKPGYLPVENGYCIMPDGTGCVATKVEMPGVTPEMIEWWFVWHSLKDLRYKIWCPTEHYAIHVLDKDMEHRMNQNLTFKQRNWGTTDVVTEDVGAGPQDMHLSFFSPVDYGYDPESIPNVDVLISANVKDATTGQGLVSFSHCIRRIEGGVEYRSHYWMGYNVDENRKADKMPLPPNGFPIEAAKAAAYHSLTEYSNLASILPGLYNIYKEQSDMMQD